MGHNYYGEPAWPSDVSTVNIYIYTRYCGIWKTRVEFILKKCEKERGGRRQGRIGEGGIGGGPYSGFGRFYYAENGQVWAGGKRWTGWPGTG